MQKYFVFFLLLLFTFEALSLELRVLDANGKSLPGAVVTWNNYAESEQIGALSDEHLLSSAARYLSPITIDISADNINPGVVSLRVGQELVIAATDGQRHLLEILFQQEGQSPERHSSVNLHGSAQRIDLVKPGLYTLKTLLHDNGIAHIYVHENRFAAISDTRGLVNLGPKLVDQIHVKVWHVGLQGKTVEYRVTSKRGDSENTVSLNVNQVPIVKKMSNRFMQFEAEKK